MITRRNKHSRMRGVLAGTAAGDALGAGYEFGQPLEADIPVMMNGGGTFRWEPGEFTDDTAMAIAVAKAAAFGDLREEATQDYLVRLWARWALTAPDVGVQTRNVLRGAQSAADARSAARALHMRTGRSGGNGSLMRTAPIALAYLNDPDGLTEAAMAVSALTHYDPEAGEACVIWTHAIRHAVLTGKLDVYVGLRYLPEHRATAWNDRLMASERMAPRHFTRNGWVVEALQAAWCSIYTTLWTVPGKGSNHFKLALEAAVRGGRDTDTVAAIAGGLLGAAYGYMAIPRAWRERIHGWPMDRSERPVRVRDLGRLTDRVVRL